MATNEHTTLEYRELHADNSEPLTIQHPEGARVVVIDATPVGPDIRFRVVVISDG